MSTYTISGNVAVAATVSWLQIGGGYLGLESGSRTTWQTRKSAH